LYALSLKRNNDARRLENKEPVRSVDFTIGCDCKMAFNRRLVQVLTCSRRAQFLLIPLGRQTLRIRGIFRPFLALPSRVFGE
jgi:hypothetical protein